MVKASLKNPYAVVALSLIVVLLLIYLSLEPLFSPDAYFIRKRI